MTRMLVTICAIGLAAGIAVAAEVKYPINGENTKLRFVGTKPGGKHEGGFKKLSGMATVTDGKLDTLKFDIEIQTDSIYTDDAKLTDHLKGSDFFGVKDQPKATFKSTKVEKTAAGYNVSGDLTMLGKTKPITFSASITLTADAVLMSTEFKIDRTDWGITYGKGQIDNPVLIKISMTAKK